ncbi:MAG: galactosyldiacylglycerol synthase [Bryobacteraceae bacterium]|nr:MAG: galactosyldiacylglycerol synthase [Bryobacteraceae bacterium]
MRLIDVIYFDAGGGHRAAATALQLVCRQQQRPFEIRLVHLKDILAPVDVFRKVLGLDLEEIYNLMLRRGWTLGSVQGLRFMHAVIRHYHPGEVRLLREWWAGRSAARAPDMVVSVVPNFNRALFEAWQAVKPGAPYVTILTDLADYPPAFWMEKQPQYFICGTEKARLQALEMGHPEERVFRVSGMILHPRFYEPLGINRAAEREKYGLDPQLPTGLVLFGGYGSAAMETVLDSVDRSGADVQLILIAGRNEPLRKKLEQRKTRLRKHVLGFTTEIPYWMRLSDFFIGKPGPGSISEALHCGLPVITVRNAWTLPQERYNAEWLEENGTGIVLKRHGQAGAAVASLLSGGRLAPMREAAQRIVNRAVFEIPAILEQILDLASSRR